MRIKYLSIPLFIFPTLLALAGEAPRTSSATIHFKGNVIENQCALELEGSNMTVSLETAKKMVPVDFTFRDCEHDVRPHIRISAERAEVDNQVRSKVHDATSWLFKDGAGNEAICITEDLLCEAEHKAIGERDNTYRAMWVKVDKRNGGEKGRPTVNLEMQFD